MPMPSINLDLDYPTHPKTKRLVDLLGRGSEVIPVRLWLYCGKHHAETGRLTGISAQEIESQVGWWGNKGRAVEALVMVGFLDRDGDTFVVHDWLSHSGHIAKYKRRAKAAAAARWSEKGGEDATSKNGCYKHQKSDACSNACALPCKEAFCFSQKTETPQKGGGVGEGFDFAPGSPEDLAQRFEFWQRGRKENPRDVAAEIREKVRVGWSLERFAAEIEAERDRSERWFQLVKRIERERVRVEANAGLFAGIVAFRNGAS